MRSFDAVAGAFSAVGGFKFIDQTPVLAGKWKEWLVLNKEGNGVPIPEPKKADAETVAPANAPTPQPSESAKPDAEPAKASKDTPKP